MLSSLFGKATTPGPAEFLPGRGEPIETAELHFVSGRRLKPPYPEGARLAMFGMGCFWGVERLFWRLSGIWVSSAGYSGGHTPNPTYREVCSGRTGHNEVVQLVYDPDHLGFAELLTIFWENHDPTQGMRQGNDVGTQYRSGIYTYDDEQHDQALASRDGYAGQLSSRGFGPVTTEIIAAPEYYFAEDYHQQYLAKNPGGYCSMRGTGVACPAGVTAAGLAAGG